MLATGCLDWYEVILDPDLLENKFLSNVDRDSLVSLWIEFLSQLLIKSSSVKCAEDIDDSDLANAIAKKFSTIKFLVLKIAAYIGWDCKFIQEKLPLPLQLILVNTVVECCGGVCDVKEHNFESLLTDLPAEAVFSTSIFFRWVTRTLTDLSVPCLPSLTKQGFPCVGTSLKSITTVSGGGMNSNNCSKMADGYDKAILLISSYAPFVHKILDFLYQHYEKSAVILGLDSFRINTSSSEHKINCNIMSNTANMDTAVAAWRFGILFDLTCFHLQNENYEIAANKLACLRQLANNSSSAFEQSGIDIKVYRGMILALLDNQEKGEHFTDPVSHQYIEIGDVEGANILEWLKDTRGQTCSIYHKTCLETTAWSSSKMVDNAKFCEQIAASNISARLEQGIVLNVDYIRFVQRRKRDRTSNKDEINCHQFVNHTHHKLASQTLIASWCLGTIPTTPPLTNKAKIRDCSVMLEYYTYNGKLLNQDDISERRNVVEGFGSDLTRREATMIFKTFDAKFLLSCKFRRSSKNLDMDMDVDIDNSFFSIGQLSHRYQNPDNDATRGILVGPKSEVIELIFCKFEQLVRLKSYDDSQILLCDLLLHFKNKIRPPEKYSSQLDHVIESEIINAQLLANSSRLHRRSVVGDSSVAVACRTYVCHPDLIREGIRENCLAALINGSEHWQFLSDKTLTEFPNSTGVAKLTKLLASICLQINSATVKTTTASSIGTLLNCLTPLIASFSTAPPSKRLYTKSSECNSQALVEFLSKLHHPLVVSIIATVLISAYNYIMDADVFNDFPSHVSTTIKPVVSPQLKSTLFGHQRTKNAAANCGDILHLNLRRLFHQQCYINQDEFSLSEKFTVAWNRTLGELSFSQGISPSRALSQFMASVTVDTHYFTHEDGLMSTGGIFGLMAKCCLDLGLQGSAVVLSQFGPGDYPSAFRALEERSAGAVSDAVEAVYQSIWDVSILEYALSMHFRRGEMSRQRLAIDYISNIEINANNNAEIIKQATLVRKSKFLAALAAQFL